ncbi:hypothetical protein HHK36_019497 [Tetracentron sinense]|uniref:F-box domain-containing protein n=1 Tax=Tetracentron sinense TaxID=13715 RepID=A0A834YTZ3_TETSI|nr:hypothetical protein HHK36_019497 [Tetracentron sinense]
MRDMSVLPDEIWRRILEIGVESSSLSYKDLCCVSISCRPLYRLSNEDSLWSTLLTFDFPINDPSFERDRSRKFAAHRRAVLRIESQIFEISAKLQDLRLQLIEETKRIEATVAELSNLEKVRQASVALNVWQPEIIRGSQKQIVEQCVVPVDSRIAALKMERKLCEQQIAVFDKAYKDQKQRLHAAKKQLESMKYHPLQDYRLKRIKVDQSNIKKKLKKCSN